MIVQNIKKEGFYQFLNHYNFNLFIVYSIFLYTGYSILIEITANEYLNYIILIPITTFYIYLRTHIIDIVILGNILYIGIVSVYKLLTL